MKETQIPKARKKGLVIQEMPDEVLVYDLDEHKAHCLNSTAAKVWQACDGEKEIFEIAKLLNNTDSKVAEDLVWLAIDQLNQNNLLENEVSSKFEGMTRRDVIKKVGIAAAVSLPIISILSFPSSALAVTCSTSVIGQQGDCPNPGEICCPGATQPECVVAPPGSCPPVSPISGGKK